MHKDIYVYTYLDPLCTNDLLEVPRQQCPRGEDQQEHKEHETACKADRGTPLTEDTSATRLHSNTHGNTKHTLTYVTHLIALPHKTQTYLKQPNYTAPHPSLVHLTDWLRDHLLPLPSTHPLSFTPSTSTLTPLTPKYKRTMHPNQDCPPQLLVSC